MSKCLLVLQICSINYSGKVSRAAKSKFFGERQCIEIAPSTSKSTWSYFAKKDACRIRSAVWRGGDDTKANKSFSCYLTETPLLPPPPKNPRKETSDYHIRSGCPRIGLWDAGKLLGFCLSFSLSQIPLDPPPSWIPDSLHHLLQPWGLTGRAGACGRTCWALAACSVC